MLNCENCKFKNNIPGDNHISCSRTYTKISNVNPHGVSNGWFVFPIGFDPMWADGCDGYINKNIDLEKASIQEIYVIYLLEKDRHEKLKTNEMVSRTDKLFNSLLEATPKDNIFPDRVKLIDVIKDCWVTNSLFI